MSGQYARIYWTVMDDSKFDGIREDVRLFGSWSLLLLVADMSWPVPAFIPPTVPRSAFGRLVAAGLIDELPGHRFRVHGMDKERRMRSQLASNATAGRWRNADSNADGIADRTAGGNADGIADSNAESMPSKAEHSKAEQRGYTRRSTLENGRASEGLVKP